MTTNTNAALRSAAESALEALEILNGIDTETESVTIHVSDEIAALRAALTAAAAPAAVASPLTKLQRKAIAVCFTSDKVSVSEVQRKLSISYADAQTLCQSIVDLGLTDELELAPSLKQRGAPAPQAAQAQAAVAGLGQETCQSCQGNGEIVTNWERYKHPSPGDRGDEAVAECQDCDGRGVVDAAPTTQAAPQPAVQQGAPVAWRSWDSENSLWNFTLWPDEWAGHADVWEPLYTYPAAPVAQGDAREETNIGKAVNRAARDLPEGWEIRIDLERHAGVVHLIDPEGNETMIEGGGELFSDQISTAIDAARSQAKEGA